MSIREEQQFDEELHREFSILFPAIEVGIKLKIQNRIVQLMTNSPEYVAITTGELREEFGLVEPEGALNAIIEVVKNSFDVEVDPKNGEILLTGDSDEELRTKLLSLKQASFVSEGHILVPWLEWFLYKFGERVLFSSTFLSGSYEQSRTDGGIMVTSQIGYRVGKHENFGGGNWIERTFDLLSPEIEVISKEVILEVTNNKQKFAPKRKRK